MLHQWAEFKHKEFNEFGWPRTSVGGKLMEVAKLGMFSYGTAHQSPDFATPDYVVSVQKAMTEISLSYRQVITMEYTEKGSQRVKAIRIKLSVTHYRAKLCRARSKLMKLI